MADNQIQRLKSQLLKSGLQNKDQPLFQVINQLIDAVNSTIQTISVATGGGGGSGGFAPNDASYATTEDEQTNLPNSRQIYPGPGIEFNDQGQKLVISTALPFGLDSEPGEEGPQGPPGIQGATGLPGSVSTILGVPIPIIDTESDEIIPTPLPMHGFESSGLWTPVLASSGGGAPTYTTQTGFWMKEKGKVTGSFLVTLATLGTLGAGTLTIQGLPFTANPTNGIPFVCIFAGLNTNQIYIYNVVNPSTTDLLLRNQAAAALNNVTNLTFADITAAFVVAGGFLYFT